MAKISFHELVLVRLRGRKGLKKFLEDLIRLEGREIERVDFIFCSDEYLLKINREYLKHDDFTDIITFDLSEREGRLVSEIYISVERVRENAAHFGVGFEKELHRVMFHGLLHLCGYKDKSVEEVKVMRGKEEEYLQQYFSR